MPLLVYAFEDISYINFNTWLYMITSVWGFFTIRQPMSIESLPCLEAFILLLLSKTNALLRILNCATSLVVGLLLGFHSCVSRAANPTERHGSFYMWSILTIRQALLLEIRRSIA